MGPMYLWKQLLSVIFVTLFDQNAAKSDTTQEPEYTLKAEQTTPEHNTAEYITQALTTPDATLSQFSTLWNINEKYRAYSFVKGTEDLIQYTGKGLRNFRVNLKNGLKPEEFKPLGKDLLVSIHNSSSWVHETKLVIWYRKIHGKVSR